MVENWVDENGVDEIGGCKIGKEGKFFYCLISKEKVMERKSGRKLYHFHPPFAIYSFFGRKVGERKWVLSGAKLIYYNTL